MAGDWVKFAWATAAALEDLEGNKPNDGELGRPLEGEKPFKMDKIQIANIDPKDDILKKAIDDLFTQKGINVKYEDVFNEKKQVAILPVFDGWAIPDSVKTFYPGSLGHVFQPDIGNLSGNTDPSEITFHAKAYYHTNLGNYVTHSEKVEISCNDPIFQINGNGDCRSNKVAFYLAWNLKDAKNRWVGTGAYVELYDFYWAVSGDPKNEVSQKIEMLGVKRIKKK
jgi:hypothetical protein